MKKQPPYPDVSCVQLRQRPDLNEVNDWLNNKGWVLLNILVTRDVAENGTFKDCETYIIGLRREGGR